MCSKWEKIDGVKPEGRSSTKNLRLSHLLSAAAALKQELNKLKGLFNSKQEASNLDKQRVNKLYYVQPSAESLIIQILILSKQSVSFDLSLHSGSADNM